GHGVVARRLASAGADAADISNRVLTFAQQLETTRPLGIRYHHVDLTRRDALADRHFDVAVCNFGLSHIDDLDGVVANVRRWLNPRGLFVASLLHPCFGGGDDVSASWPSGQTYYDERWWQADGERSRLRHVVGANHRTLSTYTNAFIKR